MKIKVKDRNYEDLIGMTILIIVFSFFAIAIICCCIFSEGTFFEKSLMYFMPLLFALLFFLVVIYSIINIFKKPVEYKAKLIKKEYKKYKFKYITEMTFKIRDKDYEDTLVKYEKFVCYTKGENDLIENNTYSIGIKEFDWRVKYITENINETLLKKMPEPAMWLVILLIDLFLLNFIICSLVLIFKYKLEYFVVAVGMIAFCSFGIWYSIKYYINNIKMKYNLMDTNNPLDKLIEFIDNKKNKE